MSTSTTHLQRPTIVPIRSDVPDPAWWRQLLSALASGRHCIGLVFNVFDYFFPVDATPRPLLPHIYEYFKEKEYDLIVTYSLSRGIEIFERDAEKESRFHRYTGLTLDAPDRAPDGQMIMPSVFLRGLHRLVTQDALRVALILDYAQHIVPLVQQGMAGVSSEDQLACVELLHSWAIDNYLNTRTQNVVIAILREGHYHELLSEHWKILRVDMPTQSDIQRFYTMLTNLRQRDHLEFAPLDSSVGLEEAARASVGLRLRTVEEMSRRAAVEDTMITLEMIKQEKSHEIQRLCGDVLEVLETNLSLADVAGLEHAKNFYRQIIAQVKDGFRNIPRALLLAGPPGCGKSYQVRALAQELGWNCLAMRAVRSMWVGESERNLERVLNAIQSNLPAILFIDEVDQMLGQRGQGGDAGTSERMLARLWEFMALENFRGRLIFVAATNRPDLLDVASVDRFSLTIPILLPTSRELEAILPQVAKQIDRSFATGINLKVVASLIHSKGLSTRQLIDVLAMAALKSDTAGKPGGPISQAALLEAAQSFRSNHNPSEIEAITLEAIRMTTFAELLPWFSDPKAYELPEFLRRLMNDELEIDVPMLDRRLGELKRELALEKAMR